MLQAQVLAAALLFLLAPFPAMAETLRVVAVGASNTWGWGVRHGEPYPDRLQAMLRKQGIEAVVKNAGVNFSTTGGMLKRLHAVVPDDTHIVIIEPGGNDLRFLGSRATRANNIERMVAWVEKRGMKAIVYEPVYEAGDFQWDRIHLKARTHNRIATELLPQVIALMPKPKAPEPKAAKTPGNKTTPKPAPTSKRQP